MRTSISFQVSFLVGVKLTILHCMFGRLESGHVASGPEVLLAVNS